MENKKKNFGKVFNINDEYYTPKILVDVLKKHLIKLIKKDTIIWLPFDTEQSEFAYLCRELNVKYICSHIKMGQDFFKYEPEKWDIAISNPPFSKKLEVFDRLNKFKKPWAMLMNLMALNYQIVGHYFVEHPCQLLIVDKRISFDGNYPSFNTSYICGNNFLSKDLIFETIESNLKNKFVSSRMKKSF